MNGYNWHVQVIVDKAPQWPADSDSSELLQSTVWTAVCCSDNRSPSADTWLGETQRWPGALALRPGNLLQSPPERETARTKRSADARRVSGPGARWWVGLSNFDIDVHQHSQYSEKVHTFVLTWIPILNGDVERPCFDAYIITVSQVWKHWQAL